MRQQQHDINFNLIEIGESRFQSTFSKLPKDSKLSSSVSFVSIDSSKSAKTTAPSQSQQVTCHGLDKTKSKKKNFDSSFHNTSPKQSSFLLQNTSLKSTSSAVVTSNDSSNLAVSSPPFQSQRVTSDYYQLHKLILTASKPTNSEDKGSYRETITKYHYTCKSKIGHGVNGPLPQFIK